MFGIFGDLRWVTSTTDGCITIPDRHTWTDYPFRSKPRLISPAALAADGSTFCMNPPQGLCGFHSKRAEWSESSPAPFCGRRVQGADRRGDSHAGLAGAGPAAERATGDCIDVSKRRYAVVYRAQRRCFRHCSDGTAGFRRGIAICRVVGTRWGAANRAGSV